MPELDFEPSNWYLEDSILINSQKNGHHPSLNKHLDCALDCLFWWIFLIARKWWDIVKVSISMFSILRISENLGEPCFIDSDFFAPSNDSNLKGIIFTLKDQIYINKILLRVGPEFRFNFLILHLISLNYNCRYFEETFKIN